MKYNLLSIICLSTTLSYQTAYSLEHKECSVEFKFNSSELFEDRNNLDICLNNLEEKNIEAITILESASPVGKQNRNNILAHERAQTISKIIKTKFPNANIKEIALGPNQQFGKKTQINFIVSKENSAQATIIQEQVNVLHEKVSRLENEMHQHVALNDKVLSKDLKQNSNELNQNQSEDFFNKNPNFRVAARIGIDNTRQQSVRNFLSAGGEAAWINRDSSFRPEIGGKILTSVGGVQIGSDKVNHITNIYGFLGAGTTALGFVTGVRALVGYEWVDIANDVPKQNQMAIGGEARIGYEWKRGTSVFASYGLTKHIQMVGVDVGISL